MSTIRTWFRNKVFWGELLSARGSTPRKQDKGCGISDSSKQGNALGIGFVLLAGVADNSEFTSDCSSLLAVIIQLNV